MTTQADPCIKLTIPGEPIAQGRGRAVRVGKGVRVVDPSRSRNWKATAQVHMRQSVGPGVQVWAEPGEPLRVLVTAYWPCVNPRKRNPRPAVLRPKKPDGDNVLKAVGDAGNGILWHDDAQIVSWSIEKWHAAQGDGPRVEIVVERLEAA